MATFLSKILPKNATRCGKARLYSCARRIGAGQKRSSMSVPTWRATPKFSPSGTFISRTTEPGVTSMDDWRGANDFDEAAEMPYVLDLVRLAASALLGSGRRRITDEEICAAILIGYRQGLHAPQPVVLHRDKLWR